MVRYPTHSNEKGHTKIIDYTSHETNSNLVVALFLVQRGVRVLQNLIRNTALICRVTIRGNRTVNGVLEGEDIDFLVIGRRRHINFRSQCSICAQGIIPYSSRPLCGGRVEDHTSDT